MPTKIEWCDETINPIVGCTKISAGCKNCYAEKMAYRLKSMGIKKYQGVVDKNGWTGFLGVDFSVFDKLPKKPKRIFIGSMGDLFHDHVSIMYHFQIFKTISEFPQHTFLMLTKRPERMLSVVQRMPVCDNLWLGVTVEHPDYLWRIEELLKIPAPVRFVSIEPMLEEINLTYVEKNEEWYNFLTGQCENGLIKTGVFQSRKIDWVIAGPETGPGARPCNPDWIKKLYEQCKEAGIPFFDKRKKGWLAREFPEEK